MKMETNIVYQEDCIEGMKKIQSNSIDLVLTDPPYSITDCMWDKPIDLERFYEEINRIIKPNGVVIMTAVQPFATDLINFNRKRFRYDLIWNKIKPSGFFNANKMPMRSHEHILVFYDKLPIFNPQKTMRAKKDLRPNRVKNSIKKPYQSSDVYVGKNIKFSSNYEEDKVNPKSIIEISNINNFSSKRIHPTQKPVELFKYLIKSYSNENQLVLDCFGGSGTTAIACIETNRKYILFENNPQYFKIINDRIQSAKSQTLLSQPSTEGSLIGIKRKPCEVSQIPNGTSLNSDNNSFEKLMKYRRKSK